MGSGRWALVTGFRVGTGSRTGGAQAGRPGVWWGKAAAAAGPRVVGQMKGAPTCCTVCQSGAALGFLASCRVAPGGSLARCCCSPFVLDGRVSALQTRPEIRYLECIANAFHPDLRHYYSTESHLIDDFQASLYISPAEQSGVGCPQPLPAGAAREPPLQPRPPVVGPSPGCRGGAVPWDGLPARACGSSQGRSPAPVLGAVLTLPSPLGSPPPRARAGRRY